MKSICIVFIEILENDSIYFLSLLVGDLILCLQIQKLLVISNSARLLSIRIVSLKIINKTLVNQKNNTILFSFVEKFQLNRFLFLHCFTWKPQKYLNFSFSVSDFAWLCLVKFACKPAQEFFFSPWSFGYRANFSVFMLQRLLFLNLNIKFLGFQRRLFLVYIKGPFKVSKFNVFFRKLIIPKCFKVSIFKFLNFGLNFNFSNNIFALDDFSSFISNVLLHGLEKKLEVIRFGSYFLFLLSPLHNELVLFYCFSYFIFCLGLKFYYMDLKIYSSLFGFDFLGWHFKFYFNQGLLCVPSFDVNISIHLYK